MRYGQRRRRSKPMRVVGEDIRESSEGWYEVPVTLADGLTEKHFYAPLASPDHTITSECWCQPIPGRMTASRTPVFLHRERRL
jgi:hypothetical protein